jgi:hypothetical protein
MFNFNSSNALTDQSVTETNPTPTRSLPGRLPVRVLGLVLALLVSLGALVGTSATPASAVAAGNVTFCLKYNNGAAYASKPVYIYRWNGSSWGSPYRSGATNAQGCATWKNLPTSNHYATQGYWSYSVGSAGYYYNGWTGSAWLSAAGGTVRQATGWVGGPYRLY